MICGKTDDQRREDRDKWRRRFAIFPVTLFDGRWIWLEHYWVRTSRSDPFGGPGVQLTPCIQRFSEIPQPRAKTAPPPKR